MSVDIDNYIQALKYQQQSGHLVEQQALTAYHRLCAVYLMNDHDKLHRLLQVTPKEQKHSGRNISSKKTGTKSYGLEQYEYVLEKMQTVERFSQQFSELCETVLLKATVMVDLSRVYSCSERSKRQSRCWPL